MKKFLILSLIVVSLVACSAPIEPSDTPKGSFSQTSSYFTDDDPVWGDESALMNMVVFSDFQCPYCAEFYKDLQGLQEEWIDTGKLKIQYRDFPLAMHQYAVPVHMAAEAAYRQGKYWEFKKIVFSEQIKWSTTEDIQSYLIGVAEQLRLDMEQFLSDMDDSEAEQEIFADRDAGREAGVTGTPGFLINGKLYRGAFTATEIQLELQKIESKL